MKEDVVVLTGKKTGFRVSLKDILSESSAKTLEDIAKAVKSKDKAETIKPPSRQKKEKSDSGPDWSNLEVEVKNDKGNPLPVILPSDTFKYSEKLSSKIDNIGALIGKPTIIDDKKLFENLDQVKKNLELIKMALESNKESFEESGKSDKSDVLLKKIEELIKKMSEDKKNKDRESAKKHAEEATKAAKDSEDMFKDNENATLTVKDAIEASNNILESSFMSLSAQKDAAESALIVLRESKYDNIEHLRNLEVAINSGTSEQLKVAMKAIAQNKENFAKGKIDSKMSLKALGKIQDLNTELLTQMEHQTLQTMFAEKYKKTAAFGQSNIAKGGAGLIANLLGVPGMETLISPLMDIGNLIGGKNILKGIKGAGGLLKDGGSSLFKNLGNIAQSATKGGKLSPYAAKGIQGTESLLSKSGALIGKTGTKALGMMGSFGQGALNLGTKAMGAGGNLVGGAGKLLGKMGGAVGGGIISAGFTGFGEYKKYKEAKEAGASKEELSKMGTKGISKTVGSGVGGAAGAAIGTLLLGPLGTVIGGVIGSIAGDWLGDKLGDFLNDMDIDLTAIPKTITKWVNNFGDWLGKGLSDGWDWITASWDKVSKSFDDTRKTISSMFGKNTVFGKITSILGFIINPIGSMITHLDEIKETSNKMFKSVTEGLDSLFGDKSIFGMIGKLVSKILDSAPVKWAMEKLGFKSASPITNVQGDISNLGKVTPTITEKTMDNKAGVLDKKELQDNRNSRGSSTNQQPVQINNTTNSKPPETASMNTRPHIDDYGLAFINSASMG